VACRNLRHPTEAHFRRFSSPRLASCILLSAALKLVDLQTAEGDATEEDDGEAGSKEGLHILGEGLVDTGGDCREGEREREREGEREKARVSARWRQNWMTSAYSYACVSFGNSDG
jgi:hypothetical protein